MFQRLAQKIPSMAFIALSSLATLSLVHAKQTYDARQLARKQLTSQIQVLPPDTRPSLSQQSIDIAIAMFAIEIPANTKHPSFDASLEDRGLTTLNGWGKPLEVTIGPAAFASWALLGSTLAHELEVHCKQNFTLIRMKDLVGADGTKEAERDAYAHELAHAERFNLSRIERMNIQATMDFYYPKNVSQDAFSAESL